MGEKEFDCLNVIPLGDVMLVLLTIVLTTSAFIATRSVPVRLSQASGIAEEALRSLTIEVTQAGAIYLHDSPVTLGDLEKALGATDRGTPVLIRADRQDRPGRNTCNLIESYAPCQCSESTNSVL